MKKKHYIAVQKVRVFMSEQPDEAQAEYLNIVERLEIEGHLVEPYAKKLETDLFEIRVRRGRQLRVFYFYHQDDLVFGVHAFVKKTQKAPRHEMKKAKKVIQRIKQGDYDE